MQTNQTPAISQNSKQHTKSGKKGKKRGLSAIASDDLAANEARRQSHNIAEKRRRDKINEKLRQLEVLLPTEEESYPCNNKAAILQKAVNYIRHLEQLYITVWEQNFFLMEENRQLKGLSSGISFVNPTTAILKPPLSSGTSDTPSLSTSDSSFPIAPKVEPSTTESSSPLVTPSAPPVFVPPNRSPWQAPSNQRRVASGYCPPSYSVAAHSYPPSALVHPSLSTSNASLPGPSISPSSPRNEQPSRSLGTTSFVPPLANVPQSTSANDKNFGFVSSNSPPTLINPSRSLLSADGQEDQ